MTLALDAQHPAGAAFDAMAADYDDLFTFSIVGRAQRDVVWNRALTTFAAGDRVLELNCGTGEDAMFLAHNGVQVTACDASAQMIEYAKARKAGEAPDASIEFLVLANEELHLLPLRSRFDGVFSNFSGLNCVADLHGVSHELASRLRTGAKLLLCLSTRFCLWETLCYGARLNFRKAVRRWRGVSSARFDQHSFPVYYPTIKLLRRSFSPDFKLRSITGVGIATPPSYLEEWIVKYPHLLATMKRFDNAVCDLPLFRIAGDHMLLTLEKVS